MFCSNCKQQIPDDSEFCPYCGANPKVVLTEQEPLLASDNAESLAAPTENDGPEVEITEMPEPEEICSCGCCSDSEKPKKRIALSKSELFKVIICFILVVTSLANTAILLLNRPSSARTTLNAQKSLEAYGIKVASKCVDIEDLELVPSTGSYGNDCIIATVENTSKKKLCNINITFSYYDKDEKLLGTKTVYIAELEKDASEEISEDIYSAAEIYSVSAESVTAFYYSDLHTK